MLTIIISTVYEQKKCSKEMNIKLDLGYMVFKFLMMCLSRTLLPFLLWEAEPGLQTSIPKVWLFKTATF